MFDGKDLHQVTRTESSKDLIDCLLKKGLSRWKYIHIIKAAFVDKIVR